jgi:hypothetical protein
MRSCSLLVALSFVLSLSLAAVAQEKAADRTVSLADGKLTMTAPEGWTKKQPASRIVEAELATPPAKGDETPGRLTAMGAGGSVEENITAGPNSSRAKGRRPPNPSWISSVGGAEVQIVDLSGTYEDKPGGPFAGKGVMRENYRMLGAIIQTKNAGNYFLKPTAPKPRSAKREGVPRNGEELESKIA